MYVCTCRPEVIASIMSGHGKRKFRLSTPKNWLRRKYAARQSTSQSFSVSIPLEKLPCFSELRLSLESRPFPDWNLVSSANALQLCQMESGSNGGPPKVSVCMEIQENLEWSVYVWSKKLNVLEHPLFCSHPTEIRSVDDFRSLLKIIERCTICKGNDDDKFDPLVRRHKGVFNDPMGT